MGKFKKLKARLLAEQGFNNFATSDLETVLLGVGFTHNRTTGSHHIYVHPGVDAPVNIQNRNGKAVPYQLRQVKTLIEENNL